MSGNLSELTQAEYEDDSLDKSELMEEKYTLTLEYDGEEQDINAHGAGTTTEDYGEKHIITQYRRRYERYIKNIEQVYTVHIAGTVSYTHLDVYKRQILFYDITGDCERTYLYSFRYDEIDVER